MESRAFASLAQVRIQLVSVGQITRPVFDKWAADIRSFEELRLGDIPADAKGEKARFLPNSFAKGHLHLAFPTHPPPAHYSNAALFRPSDFPLGVIGVASCSQDDSLSSILAQFNATVNELFPAESTFPLARNLFVFEDDDGNTNLNVGDELPGLVVIPCMMGNKKIYIGTLLADMCSHILAEFSTLVQVLETPLGNEYLNSAVFPILPSPSDLPKPLDEDNPRRHSVLSLASTGSQPELTAAASILRGKSPVPSAAKRASTVGPGALSPKGASFRHSTLGVPPAATSAKKKPTTIGTASSHGRLFKFMADLFLLSGRTEDAIIWYGEAINSFKTPQDAVWHASALEGLAVVAVVDAWTAGYGLNTSFSTGQEPWGDIVENLTQAAAMYAKGSPTADGDPDYPFVSFLYANAILRHASLLFAVWSAKGWGPLAFTTMLQPGPTPALPPTLSTPEGTSYNSIERLCSITGISRGHIAAVVAQAHGPWLLHVGPRERLSVLESMAGLFACLGFKRKEAYILRELLGCIMDLVVMGRAEGNQAKASTPGLGIEGAPVQSPGLVGGAVGIRENERTDGNESILQLVKYIGKVHGVDFDAVRLVQADSTGDLKKSLAQNKPGKGDSSDEPIKPVGWPELQVGIVREALAVAEALPDHPSVAQFCLSALKTLYQILAPDDQRHLYLTSARALATARRRGDNRTVEYWSRSPVVNVEVMPLPFVRLPMEKTLSVLAARPVDPLAPRLDPFLYNPRKAMSTQGKPVVVQNEDLEFVVVLRNPYVFDIDFQSIALSTAGVPLQTKSVPAVIPANSFHRVILTGKPQESGTLTVKGCVIKAGEGLSREFLLPLSTDDEDDRQSRRRSAAIGEMERFKYGGLEARLWGVDPKRMSRAEAIPDSAEPRYLECKVVPEQPLLRIRRSSLTHGALMLYNGERSSIRITLENVSTLPIDFLKLTFDDSTIAPAQQALAEGEMSVFDTYETEYSLIHRPVFAWDEKQTPKVIEPGEKASVTIICAGKVGCTSGSIQISYGYVHRRKDKLEEPSNTFHFRQLAYPVVATVYHMLECYEMDILPYEYIPSDAGEDPALDSSRRALMQVPDEAGWCLFVIEVRNTYGLPFEVTFDRAQEGTEHGQATALVPPGSTARILLPLKKIRLSEEICAKPIPTLSDRQFIVDKSGLTSAQEKTQRELFWYREELISSIRGRWKEAGGTRAGELSLRHQRMTLHMLEAFRIETVRVNMSLLVPDQSEQQPGSPVARKGSKYKPPVHSLLCLRITSTNLSPKPLALSLDLAMEPFEHILCEGTMSDVPIGLLGPGDSADIEVPVCFMAFGTFDLVAEARVLSREPRRGAGESVGVGRLVAEVV